MSSSYTISEDDVRSLVGLLGRVAVEDTSLEGKKRCLMEDLADLIGADCWIWGAFLANIPGNTVPPAALMHGGFSEKRFIAYLDAVEHPDLGRYNGCFLEEVYGRMKQTTRLRQQLDPGNTFIESPAYPLWCEAELGSTLLSAYPFEDKSLSMVAFYRDDSKPDFTKREAKIVHVILSEVLWLHAQSWPQAKRIQGKLLSPRLRTTLNLLLEGLGRKQIAWEMHISENTVAGYVKEVYRFYQVHSHAELLHYFRVGDGGDQ